MAGRQRDDFLTLDVVKRTSANEQRASASLDNRCEGSVDCAFVPGFHNQDLPSERVRRRLHVPQLGLDIANVRGRVPQKGDDGGLRNQFMQQFQAPRPAILKFESYHAAWSSL
jgi:hypothetical protein